MTRRRCDECGTFLRGRLWKRHYSGLRSPTVTKVSESGEPMCHVCALVRMTSQQVRWDDDEERGYDAEGESLNAIEHRSFLDPWYGGGTAAARLSANSTDDTWATSMWLPPNASVKGAIYSAMEVHFKRRLVPDVVRR